MSKAASSPLERSLAIEEPIPTTTSTKAAVQVANQEHLVQLAGPQQQHLRILARELGIDVGQRGETIRIQGDSESVALAERVLRELLEVLQAGHPLRELEIARAAKTLRDHPDLKLKELFEDVILVAPGRRAIAPKGVAQQHYVHSIRRFDLVFGVGPAGTGKTYLAMALALQALLSKRVKRIVLTRPAVEAGEKLGFLPGDLVEKVNPYLRPLYDALHDMLEMEKIRHWMDRGVIEVAPLAFMRGRTLSDSFVILDEAQNTTQQQMKMFLTRLGYGAKAVVTGDITQVDLPAGKQSGLREAIKLLAAVEGIKVCRFSDVDVVRHPLVQRIVQAYESQRQEIQYREVQ